jgi:toxin HigB-1
MIISFHDKRTRVFFDGERVEAFQGFERQAMLRLDRLHAADRLMALNTPGNRLEALKGDRKGHFSIRINDQWRSVLNGRKIHLDRLTWRLWIIIRRSIWHDLSFIQGNTWPTN